jgi:hypothetical protein
MTIEELQQEEIEQLTQSKESLSLESLIVEGSELTIPITFDYPTRKGLIKASAIIKPLTTTEWENAQNYAMKNKKDFMVKILSKGLLNDDGEPIKEELIRKMPFGVASELYVRIADVSGVKQNKEEQYKLTKDLLGF